MKKFKRNVASDFFITDMGITVPASGELIIDPTAYSQLVNSSDSITAVVNGDLVFNDGSNDITNIALATSIIQGGTPQVDIKSEPPFAAKTIGSLKLYNRTTGMKYSVSVGQQNCIFTIPFPQMKFNGLEIVAGEIGDECDLYVWDSINGDYTTVPNMQLNQFGYTVAVAKEYFAKKSNYDADVFVGMQIVVSYNSVSAKDIWINYDVHELKP